MANPNFERTFAELAHAHQQARAPRLLDHMIGFQVVDKNEDESRAFGIFVFKVGRQYVFAPVIYLNGELKGTELMWLPDVNMMVPRKEGWVQDILSREVRSPGAAVDLHDEITPPTTPDFSPFYTSPFAYTKSGEARVGYWVKGPDVDVGECLDELLVQHPFGDPDWDKAAERMDLRAVARRTGPAFVDFLKAAMEDDPAFMAAFDHLYDIDEVLKAASEFKLDRSQLSEAEKDDPKPVPDVVVFDCAKSLSEFAATQEEREKFMRDGVVIRDRRSPEDIGGTVSVVYDLDSGKDIAPVRESGTYSLLQAGGDVMDARVFTDVWGIGETESANAVLVVDRKRRRAGVVPSHGVVAWKGPEEPLQGGGSPKNLETNKTYILVSKDGTRASEPFRVLARVRKDGNVLYEVKTKWTSPRYRSGMGGLERPFEFYYKHQDVEAQHVGPRRSYPLAERGVADAEDYGPCVRLVVVRDAATAWAVSGVSLYVPGDAVAIPLESLNTQAYRAPSTLELDQALIKKAGFQHVTVFGRGGEYVVRAESLAERPLDKSAAVLALVKDLGVALPTAEDIVKSASKGSRRYLVKAAYPGLAAPYVPGVPDPGYGQGPGGVPVMPEQDVAMGVQGMPEPYPERGEPDLLQGLVENVDRIRGKEVFDATTLASMLRTADATAEADRSLPDFYRAVDRLGRLLLLFYWKNDEFRERYGDSDMHEFETSLRSLFDDLGDFVLFLKTKSVDDRVRLGESVELDAV